MSSPSATQTALDGAAVCLSGLCLIHCVALPLIVSVAPWMVPGLFADEQFHLWAVAIAVPVSAAALAPAVRAHRRMSVVALAAGGLAALVAGALWVEEGWPEVLVSVVGALALAGAHVQNWRLLQQATRR